MGKEIKIQKMGSEEEARLKKREKMEAAFRKKYSNLDIIFHYAGDAIDAESKESGNG